MLIFTRRLGETVRISDDIFCTVLGFKGKQVRLGFSAPENISIHREEIYLKIQENQKELLEDEQRLLNELVAVLIQEVAERIKQRTHSRTPMLPDVDSYNRVA